MSERHFHQSKALLFAAQLIWVLSWIYGPGCASCFARNSQDNSGNLKFMGIYLGTGIVSNREDLIVPLGFSGPGFLLGGNYSRFSEKNNVDIQLKLGLAVLENRYSQEAYAATLEIRSNWTKIISHDQRSGEFWGGISLYMRMNNLAVTSWDDAHLYWLTGYALGPAARWNKSLSPRYDIAVTMETPLIGLVSRPPQYRYQKQEALNHWTYHFTEPNSSLHLETLDTYRAMDMQVLITKISNRSLLKLGLDFQYNYFREPRKIYGLNTLLNFHYQWRVGK